MILSDIYKIDSWLATTDGRETMKQKEPFWEMETYC